MGRAPESGQEVVAKKKKVLLTTAALAAPRVQDGVYIGCDQSYTGTGLVALAPDGTVMGQGLVSTKAPSAPLDELKRFLDLYSGIDSFVRTHSNGKPVCICMEDFAFSQANQMANLGGLGWFLRMMFWRAGHHLSVIGTGSLKKCATGKGNANKAGVVLGCYKRWGFETENDNVADARTLAHLCWVHYAKPVPDSRLVLQRDLECVASAKTYT